MGKILQFVKLDFITNKPFMMDKTRLIFFLGAMALLFVLSGGIAGGLAFSFFFANIFATNPFLAKLDTLYIALAIDKKTVVIGRYIYSYVVAVLTTVVVFLMGLALTPISFGALEFLECNCCYGGPLNQMIVIFAITAAVQVFSLSISLPLNFKMGEAMTRIFGVVPMLAFMAITRVGSLPVVADVIGSTMGVIMSVAVVLGMVVAVYVSYALSLKFYEKREF